MHALGRTWKHLEKKPLPHPLTGDSDKDSLGSRVVAGVKVELKCCVYGQSGVDTYVLHTGDWEGAACQQEQRVLFLIPTGFY